MRYTNKLIAFSVIATLLTACSDGTGPKGMGIYTLISVNDTTPPMGLYLFMQNPVNGTGATYQIIGSGTLDLRRQGRWVRTFYPPKEADNFTFVPNPRPPTPYSFRYYEITDSGSYTRNGDTLTLSPEVNIEAATVILDGSTLSYTTRFQSRPNVRFVWKK